MLTQVLKQGIIIILLLSIFSCTKDNLKETLEDDFLGVPTTIHKGALKFETLEGFETAGLNVTKAKEHEVEEWLKTKSFNSMKLLFNEVNDAFEKVTNKEQYDSFEAKYEEVMFVEQDKSLTIKNYIPTRAFLLNAEGIVYVGENLHCYIGNIVIIILGGDQTKLKRAKERLETSEKEGIYVLKTRSEQSARTCPEDYVYQTCNNSDSRLKCTYDLQYNASSTTGLATGPWRVHNTLACNIISQKRGFLGIWGRKRTTIHWSIGWGVNGGIPPSQTGGTGWVQQGASEVNYTTSIGPVYPNLSLIDANSGLYSYDYTYLYTDVYTPFVPDCDYGCTN